MNLLNIFLGFILNIRSGRDLCNVTKVFFLENDFWCDDQERLKAEKGYLYRVNLYVERKSGFNANFYCYPKTCYPLKSTNLGYFVLRYWSFEKDVNSFLKSLKVDEFLLIFRFFFTNEPIDNIDCVDKYNTNLQEYVTYKLPEKITENSINLRSDGIYIHLKYIKERFEVFLSINLLKFNEYDKILDKKKLSKIEDNSNFNLYYFKNHSECFKNLREFIKELRYFNLLEDDAYNSSVDTKNTLKVSQFRERFHEKLYEKIKGLYDFEIDETWNPFFDECCNYLENEIGNNLIYPIRGKYDIDYYIVKLSSLICELVEKRQGKSTNIPEDKVVIFYKIIYLLKFNLENLKLVIVQDLCESEYIPKHFSKFLEREIETLDDYIEVEKMVCDYYNLFVNIINTYNELNRSLCVPYSYFSPIFIDNYNLKIIDGIEINFRLPAKFGQIKGFDDKGEEINMVKDSDYFVDRFNILYCPSEVLKMKKIVEIELISFDDKKNKKKFKINNYLNV